MAGQYDFTYRVGFVGDTKDLVEKLRVADANLSKKTFKLNMAAGIDTTEAQKTIDEVLAPLKKSRKKDVGLQDVIVQTQTLRTESGITYTEITGLVLKYKDAQGKLVTSFKDVKNNITDIQKNINVYDQISKKAADWGNRAENMGAKEKKAIQETANALLIQIARYKELAATGTDDARKRATSLTPEIAKLNQELDRQISLSKRAATGVQGWANSIYTAFKNSIAYATSIQLIQKAQQELNKALQFTIELNKEMVNIQVLQAEGAQTDEEIRRLSVEYNNLAKQMGATTMEVAKGSVEWLRQGKTIQETTELLKSTLMLSKLGALDSAQATEYLTSTLNSYKLEAEDATRVVDRLIAVDNNSATSTRELATALRYSAATAAEAGVTLDQLISYIGVTSSVTRINAESIGQAFKTIFSRMQDIKAGKIDEDGLGINNVESALSRVDIKLRDSQTSFRDFSTVLEELASKWNTLNEVEQANIGKAVAGVRQRNMFSVLMTNMNTALELQTIQANSAGMAMDRYDIYLKNIEASQQKVKASAEALYMSFGGFKDIIITINNLTSSFLDLLKSIGGLPTILITLLSLFIAIRREAIATAVVNSYLGFISVIKQFTAVLQVARAMGVSFTVAMNFMAAAGVTAGISMKALQASLISTGIGAVIVLIGVLVSGLVSLGGASDRAAEALENSKNKFKELSGVVSTTAQELNKLEDSQSKYYSLMTKDNAGTISLAEKKEYLKIQKEIIDASGMAIYYYDEEGNAILDQSSNLETLIALKKEELKLDKEKATTAALDYAKKELGEYSTKKKNLETSKELARQSLENDPMMQGTFDVEFFNDSFTKQYEQKYLELAAYKNNLLKTYFSLGKEGREMFIAGLLTQEGGRDIYQALLGMISKAGKKGGDKRFGGEAEVFGANDKLKKGDEGYTEALTTAIATYNDAMTEAIDLQKKEHLSLNDVTKAKDMGLEVIINENGQLEITKESLDKYNQKQKDLIISTLELDDAQKANLDTLIQHEATVDQFNDTLDNLRDTLSAVKDAQDEQNENGYISYNTALDLVSANAELGNYLTQTANGFLFDADAAIKDMTAKVQNQIATYLLTDYNYNLQMASIAAADGQFILALQLVQTAGLADDTTNSLVGLLGILGQLSAPRAPSGGGGGGGSSKSQQEIEIENQIKAKEAQIKSIEKTIKGLEKEKDAIKDNVDQYKKYIDTQKEILKLKKEEKEYIDEIAQKNKSLAKLQNQIATLALDDSEEARAKRLELEEEVAKAETDIAETKEDRKYDLQVQALDNLEKQFEENADAQIKAIDKIIEAHRAEIEAIREIIDALREQGQELSKLAKGGGGGGGGNVSDWTTYSKLTMEVFKKLIEDLKLTQDEMLEYGPILYKQIQYWLGVGKSADDAIEATLRYYRVLKNRPLWSDPGYTGSGWEDDYKSKGSNGLVGIVPPGYPNDSYKVGVESDELLMVFNKQQQEALKSGIKPITNIASMFSRPATSSTNNNSNSIVVNMPINVEGNMDKDTIPELKRVSDYVIKQLDKNLLSRGFIRTSNQTVS